MATTELASIYMPYSNLGDDKNKPTEKMVTRGYIENKDKVVFPMFPGPKLTNGRSHTIDGGKQNTQTTVKYFALPTTGVHILHLVLKFVEFNHLLSELGWDAHEAKLLSTEEDNKQEHAKLKCNALNKFSDDGTPLSGAPLAKIEKQVIAIEKLISFSVKAINTTADRASQMLGRLVGAYQSKLNNITTNYFKSTSSHSVQRWDVIKVPCCKNPVDPTKMMFPLMKYEGDVDETTDETSDYKMQYMAVFHTVEVEAHRRKTLKAIQLMSYKLLVDVHGYGLAEATRTYLERNIRFPVTLVFTCKEWSDMLVAINNYLPYLTTFKDDERYKDNAEIPRANVEFTQVELCKILLHSMPDYVRTALNVQSPHKLVETDLTPLVERIDAILVQRKADRNLDKAIKTNPKPGPTKPSNQKKQGGGGGKSGGGDKSQYKKSSPENPRDGGCSNCQKAGKGAWHTHGTRNCHIFNTDGSKKGSRGRDLRDHDKKAEMEDLYDMFNKFQNSRDKRDHYRHERRDRSRSRSHSRSRSRSPGHRRSKSRRYDDRY